MAGGWNRRPPRFQRRGIVDGVRDATGGRALPILMTFAGVAVIIVTQAVRRGLITGVAIDWPAYLVGAVLILFGIAGLRGRVVDDPPETGPIRESGIDPRDVDDDDDGIPTRRPGRPGSWPRGR